MVVKPEISGMKNLFEAATLAELQERLTRLKPDSKRQWGKMDPAQMLAHCSEWIEIAEGVKNPPRSFAGRIFGRFAKSRVLSERPIARNMPTDSSLIVRDEREFALERQRLKRRMERFTTAGPEGCTRHPHSFFGAMSPAEWARLAYKHLDHHLRQFGV